MSFFLLLTMMLSLVSVWFYKGRGLEILTSGLPHGWTQLWELGSVGCKIKAFSTVPRLAFLCYYKCYPRYSGLKQHPFVFHTFCGSEVDHSVAQLVLCFESNKAKIQLLAGLFSADSRVGENLLPVHSVVKIKFQEAVGLRSCYLLAELVLSFWGCLHSLAHGSLQSQQQWVEFISSLESDSSPASFIQGISSVFKDPYAYLGPTR